MNGKGKSLNKQYFYQNNKMFCGIKVMCLNAVFWHFWFTDTDTAPQSFCHSFVALSMTHCS